MSAVRRASRASGAVAALLLSLASFAPLAWSAGDAHGGDAAHDQAHGPSLRENVLQALNLAILLGVIVYAARKPVRIFFADRRERIQGELDEASDYLKQAENRYGEWQRKLADLDTELEKIRATSRRRAQEERDVILADAQAAAERIRQDARVAADQELRRARNELRQEASDLAVELASKMLSEQVGDDDRRRLLDDFIARIEHLDDAGGTQ